MDLELWYFVIHSLGDSFEFVICNLLLDQIFKVAGQFLLVIT